MLSKKKHHLNYIIFGDGSAIPTKSLKGYKSFELLKDQYSPTYLANFQTTNRFDLSEKTNLSKFFKKYATK